MSTVDYLETERMVTIRVEATPQLWASPACPHCGRRPGSGYAHAPERRWRPLNGCPLESEIVCALPRGQCRDCQKVFTGRAPWEGRSPRCPQEFEALARTRMREMPVKQAGEILGETDQKRGRRRWAPGDAAWAGLSWENGGWVGADEMNRQKGHHYLTVFVDLEAQRALRAVAGKAAPVWERFAAELGRHNGPPQAITPGAIDLSPAYVKGVKANFGNAAIGFDKFHVVSQVAAAVDAGRRAETRQAAAARAPLEQTCWLWRKHPEGWTEREAWRREQWKDKPRVTGLAYARRLELPRAYAAVTASQARSRLVKWCQVGAAGGGGVDRWIAGAPAESGGPGRASLGRQLGTWAARLDDGVLGRPQPSVLSDQAQSPR